MANDKLTPRDKPLAVGDAAPDFELQTQDKAPWRLSDHVKKGDVVLCFYPMDFSPVCSTEMKCITEDFQKWQAKGATVAGISCDSFFVHEAWAKSLGLKQTLLADMHREVCKAYGMYWPDLNISGRGTFVIGQSDDGVGKVKWVQKREVKDAMKSEDLAGALG